MSSVLFSPLPYTALTVHRWAKIIGLNPAHFAGAAASGLSPQVFPVGGCDSIWFQYDWQSNDKVSREQVAYAIYDAEQEVANFLGYLPAPLWVTERHQYPRHFAREYFGTGKDIRGRYKSIKLNYDKVIAIGTRAVSLIDTVAVSYSDQDSDGFFETATVTVDIGSTNPKEVKFYYEGYNGDQEYEIRYPYKFSVSGTVATAVFKSWLLINPILYEAYPTSEELSAIDISTTSNFVTNVDVYREYNDTTSPSAHFYWNNDTFCDAYNSSSNVCSSYSQSGCATIRDPVLGTVSPFPAEYVDGSWYARQWARGVEPDYVDIGYRSGEESRNYLRGVDRDPLSEDLARAIAMIAAARLERPICSCDNAEALVDELRKDMSLSSRESGTYMLTQDMLNCPFGTRVGEIRAWRKLLRLRKRNMEVSLT